MKDEKKSKSVVLEVQNVKATVKINNKVGGTVTVPTFDYEIADPT